METPIIKVGTVIMIDGHEIVVINIETHETLDGRGLWIRAADKESADRLQHEMVEAAKVKEATVDSMSDLMKNVGPMLKKMFGDSEKGYS